MRLTHKLQRLAVLAAAASSLVPSVYGWGAAGHEIVATIAQIHIHPSVLPVICDLLDITPSDTSEATLRRQCHLASIATWADRERMRMRWSAAMHYVGAVDDHPGDNCQFPGPGGWAGTKDINVLDAFKNVTRILGEWSGANEHEGSLSSLLPQRAKAYHPRTTTPTRLRLPSPREEEAFKFLVHFVGDMHQPLHLTGRDRGGNGVKVVFEHRESNLHSVWDTAILTRLIRTVPSNYSRPLPDSGDLPIPSWQVEIALRHAIYDPFIRRVMWEGVESKWIDDIEGWLSCPVPAQTPTPAPEVEGEGESQTSLFSVVSTAFSDPFGLPRKLVDLVLLNPRRERVDIQPDGPVLCPYAWSIPLHKLNCDYIWPKELNFTHSGFTDMDTGDAVAVAPRPPPRKGRYPTLDTPQYMAALDDDFVMEKLVAQGGLRLAGILNWLFADYGDDA